MSQPAARPRRPPVLIAALVALPLAALLFGMTGTNLRAPDTGLPSLATLFSLLAIRFAWARATSVAMLAFLTVQWLPGAAKHMDDQSQAASYVLIGTTLFAAGAVLAFLAPSNEYYRQAAHWRKSRKQQRAE